MSSGALWYSAYLELHTLGDRQWLDSIVCDFYLASLWHDHESRHENLCRFAMIFRHGADLHLSSMEIDHYRYAHQVPVHEPCPLTPVSFLVHDTTTAHYFPVVFDYDACIAYVFGRRVNGENQEYDADWSAWRGSERWEVIAELHRWEPGNVDEVVVISMDWEQNGYDCGPITCWLIKTCMEIGLEETYKIFSKSSLMKPPPVPCGHVLRLHMIKAIRRRSLTAFQHYMYFAGMVERPPHWDPMELNADTIMYMQSGGDQERDCQLMQTLTIASKSCLACRAFISQQVCKAFVPEDIY